MSKQREPIKLIQAKGKKHLTKAEIEQREQGELQPKNDSIKPPKYLTKEQKKRFKAIAKDLDALGIMGNTDCDALARYIIAEEMYIKITEKLSLEEISEDIVMFEKYIAFQDKYFKQCRAAANDLGLSISSRCKLVVPKADEPEKENKFTKYEQVV